MRSALKVCSVMLLSLCLATSAQASGNLVSSKVMGAVKGVMKATATAGAVALLVCGSTGCDQTGQGKVADMVMAVEKDGGEMMVKIGMNYDARYDINAWTGAQLAVDEINAAGGIHGMEVELLARDNMKDLAQSIALTNDLIHNHNVVALVGPEYSTHAIETGTIANANRVPMISTTATNPNVARTGKYVFQAAFSDDFQGLLMANFAMNELGAMTAAVITESGDVYSEGLSTTFITNFTGIGGTLVAHQRYTNGDTDFSSQLAAVQASGADVVFVPGFMPEVALLVKQGRSMGIEANFIGADGWANDDLVKIGGEAMEGTHFSSHFYSIPEIGLSNRTIQFIHSHIDVYGERPISRSALGYDAVYLIAQAIERAGSLEGADIIAEIAATSDYDGATFISGFGPEGHARKAAVVETVRDGATVFHSLVRP
ncbi:MAG: ABC transporter substrate-binding protein [Pseudomonadota bacterium]|nr:ABC transporter substrate-binding protein [Pseudomonadota bacterium]